MGEREIDPVAGAVTLRPDGRRRRNRAAACSLLVALAVGGCVNAQARLRHGLNRAGLSPPMADCVSARMVDRLSVSQLRRIGRLRDLRDDFVRDGSVEQFLRNIAALRDPEILAVATTSATYCSILTRRS